MKPQRVTDNKVERAKPFASQVEAGNVYLVRDEWNKDYIHQYHNFPQTKLKDMVDASSGAFNALALRGGAFKWDQFPIENIKMYDIPAIDERAFRNWRWGQ